MRHVLVNLLVAALATVATVATVAIAAEAGVHVDRIQGTTWSWFSCAVFV
jgi:hypothetical protein